MNTLSFLDTIGQDLRYGMRILRRNPTFALVAILALALGTGANAAIFQLVNANVGFLRRDRKSTRLNSSH